MKEFLEVTVLIPKAEVFLEDAAITHEWNPDKQGFELLVDETVHIDIPCLGDFEIQDWDEAKVDKWAIEKYLEDKGGKD